MLLPYEAYQTSIASMTPRGEQRRRPGCTGRRRQLLRRRCRRGLDGELAHPVPRVVDVHDVASHPVQQAGGDPGAVAGLAVHPQLAAGQRRARPARRPGPAGAGRPGRWPRSHSSRWRTSTTTGCVLGREVVGPVGAPVVAVAASSASSTRAVTPSMPMSARSRSAGSSSVGESVSRTMLVAPRHQPADVRRELAGRTPRSPCRAGARRRTPRGRAGRSPTRRPARRR